MSPAAATSYLTRPEGRVAYDVDGAGPWSCSCPAWATCAPRTGSSPPPCGRPATGWPALRPARPRRQRRHLRRLRGHRDRRRHRRPHRGARRAGGRRRQLDGRRQPPSLAAAERPELVAGLVLVGPFVRDPEASARPAAPVPRSPWRRRGRPPSWKAYLPKLYAGRRPADFDEYRRLRSWRSLRRPGYARAFSRTTRTSHAPAEARLADVDGAGPGGHGRRRTPTSTTRGRRPTGSPGAARHRSSWCPRPGTTPSRSGRTSRPTP